MIKLTGNKVGVIPIFDGDKVGSLWIPESAKDRCDQGIVQYMGPDCKHVEIGAYVTFSGYSGTRIQIQDPDVPTKIDDLIIIPEDFCYAEIIDIPNTEVPGLFFQGRDGYFPATYEQAMMLIRRAVQDADWRQYNPVLGTGINVKTRAPSADEYNKLRGG